VEERTALEAWADESQFNAIDRDAGWKIDLIMRRSRPFSLAEFERRLPITFDGVDLFVASAEDVVIAKLEWAKVGESRRQIEDAAGWRHP
jgi:hypothetical protein